MSNRGAGAAVLMNYMTTVVNYGLAVPYVVLLTRFVPLEDYGYYNAILAFATIISMLFPTLGIDNAIAREAAAARARGGDIWPYFSAMAVVVLAVSIIHAVAITIAAPHAVQTPRYMYLIIYLVAASVVLRALASAYGLAIWAQGRTYEQGIGSTIYAFVYRTTQIALLLALRNVYAVQLGILAGHAAQLAYYLYLTRRLPSIPQGIKTLRAGARRYMALGVQFWGSNTIFDIYANLQTYLVYIWLGPAAAGLLSTAALLVGMPGAAVSAINNVYGAKAAYMYGRGEPLVSLTETYLRAGTYATGVLTLAFASALPLIPALKIAVGEYVEAIPLAALLAPTVVLGVADALLLTKTWIEGRGSVAVARATLGVAAGLTTFTSIAYPTGSLYAVVAGTYATRITIIAYYLARRELAPSSVKITAAITALILAGVSPQIWWAPPIALAALALVALAKKPIPQGALEGMPLRRLLKPFTA